MTRYRPRMKLREGDKLIVDGQIYEIGGHISDDEVGLLKHGEEMYERTHIDEISDMVMAAESVVVVRE